MPSPETAERISNQIDELKRRATALSSEVWLYSGKESEPARRAEEMCAAIQRMERLDRFNLLGLPLGLNDSLVLTVDRGVSRAEVLCVRA